jgi:hypothetical protein
MPEADHWCRRWDSNPHEVALTGFFESGTLHPSLS